MTSLSRRLALCASAAAVVAVAVAASTDDTSGPPKVNIGRQVVAGLSAGAFFAVQYQVAFSSELVGAGIVAGGPFYCAQGELTTALTACMSEPSSLDVSSSVAAAKACASGNVCDPLTSLAKHNVYLFSGTHDSVVDPGVMQKLQQFYSTWIPSSQINTTFTVPAEHSWVTNDFGLSCGSLGEPFFDNCAYETANHMMSQVLGAPQAAPGPAANGSFYTMSQDTYAPDGDASAISFGPSAYVYAPTRCQAQGGDGTPCTLVIAAHGCKQTIDQIGLTFVKATGLNELAETNGYVVLYPQVQVSYLSPSNPSGCFDWWGASYTGDNYSNQKGPQMATVNAMAKALAGGSAAMKRLE